MKPNQIKAQNIARGFDCHGDCDSEIDCIENGCVSLRSDIEAALDAKDRRTKGAGTMTAQVDAGASVHREPLSQSPQGDR